MSSCICQYQHPPPCLSAGISASDVGQILISNNKYNIITFIVTCQKLMCSDISVNSTEICHINPFRGYASFPLPARAGLPVACHFLRVLLIWNR